MANRNTSKCAGVDTTQPLSVDFAASDVILEPADYVRNPDLQMYPTVATAVVPIYNLNSTANLTLSTAVLAQIFSGQILTWDDPRIVALNPNFSTWRVPAGQRIEVVVRDSGSGTTGVFRQALCYFDSVFAQQVGPGTDAAWSGVNVTRSARPQAYVTVTPFTVSYTPYDIAVEYSLPIPKLKKATGAVVTASQTATTYALLELGLTFGNNGDDAHHLTAELSNAQGDNAWPIATYTYLIMRKSSAKSGATCAAVEETAKFWYWFWTSDLAASIVKSNDFTPLPDIIKQVVVGRFMEDITCHGQPVLSTPQSTVITGAGVSWVASVLEKFALVYTLEDATVLISYRSVPLLTEAAVEAQLNTDMFVASHVPWTSTTAHTGVKLALAGIAVVVISQYNLTLDLATLAAILEGTITTWMHPDILRLNNGVLRQSDGTRVTDASRRIVLINGPTFQDPFLADLLRAAVPSFTGAAMAAARYFSSDDLLRAAVAATPFSLGISVMVGSFDSNLLFASLKRPSGVVVAPSWQSVQACAGAEVYSPLTGDYRLESSTHPDCYPMSSAVYVTVRQSQCSMVTDPQRTAAVAFLEWLLQLSSLAGALEEELVAPLTLLAAVNATNQAALGVISCKPPTPASSDWLPVVIGACCGGLAFIIGLIGLWVWKSTADMRALRKQFANDNVAQECAAAIASFDLESVMWLKTLENPNRIQRSFLQIIHLLTEVRPFIPDQLLASLQRGESEVVAEDEKLRDRTPLRRGRQQSACRTDLSDYSDGEPEQRAQSPQSAASSLHSPDAAEGKRCPSPVQSMRGSVKGMRRSASPRGTRRGPLATEWRRRVTVFMYIRFGFSPSVVAEPDMPQCVTALLVDLVTIAKGHGATIDHVGYGCLALHWGVAFSTAQGPLKATTTALEMAQLRQHLPGHLKEALQLRAAVTYGQCDVSTATAAGHKFFVVAGAEVQTAMDVVVTDSMSKCKCEILISQAVYQEVQYAVECMPRLWFDDVLLWEPRHMRQHSGSSDEWMYELQNFEAPDGQRFCAKVLHPLFLMARNEASRAHVQAEARRLRAAYGPQMSDQDLAALQHLTTVTAAEAWSLPNSGAGDPHP
eukprot:EG_transcript_498